MAALDRQSERFGQIHDIINETSQGDAGKSQLKLTIQQNGEGRIFLGLVSLVMVT